MTTKVDSCIFEYNDDGAITLDAYGYKTTYNLQIVNVFFEISNAGPHNNYKDRSGATITVNSPKSSNGELDPSAAEILFEMRGCYFVDVTDKATTYGFVYINCKTLTAIASSCYINPAISDKTKMYTGSINGWTDFTKNYLDTKKLYSKFWK
ncbi:hypothetical protein PU683_13575 [Kosakonia cowanii]|uniref:hypothetical protein n=1 Tax=Kosakonia cowanii TaxID=208223 RepID=UPI0023F7347C|nr:hypothetical protein [Kosakonia cowanii]MDF7760547.1 hypothetical protein [Kosakonia cowanii]